MSSVLFHYLIFPGFLFTAVAGMLVSWVDRKVTARVQWRKGPPWWQNFADFIKLLGKEVTVPASAAKTTFLSAPLFGVAAVTVVSTLLWRTIINPQATFLGDLVVVLYLLTIPSIAVIMGGFASGNPLASLGASREMKLILAYELPFILACLIPVIKAGTINLGEIINFQINNKPIFLYPSGIIGLLVGLICIQAKLGFIPFDIAEAEQEIMSGPYIEYSGAPLALFRLTRQMMLFVLPMFIITIFLGKFTHFVLDILKYIILLVLIILIKNTAPRVRVDQAIKFFWTRGLFLGIVGVLLALLGE
jgi:NADH-quinone oxidoreductase subunit H